MPQDHSKISLTSHTIFCSIRVENIRLISDAFWSAVLIGSGMGAFTAGESRWPSKVLVDREGMGEFEIAFETSRQ